MDTHHHIDEISVWSCVAALVFFMVALTATFVATRDNVRLAHDSIAPALPLTEPVLIPPAAPLGPRA